MRKRKLLVIAGAGASLSFGMPSVADVDKDFNLWASDHHSLADNPDLNLYGYLSNQISKHFSRRNPPEVVPNFEDILHTIYKLGGLFPDISSSPICAFIDLKSFPDVNSFGKRQKVNSMSLYLLASELVDKLVENFRFKCIEADDENILEIKKLRGFFAALKDNFDLSIVTPNYDNLIYRSLPGLETGFDMDDNGRFRPERILRPVSSSWSFFVPLHGSVHFDMDDENGRLHEIYWQNDLSEQFNQNSSGRNQQVTIEGNSFLTSTIIAGYGKTEQIQRFPFRTYYSKLDSLVEESDAILCLGYGFGDTHINNSLTRYRDYRNRPIVVVDFVSENSSDLTAGSGNGELSLLSIRRLMWYFSMHPSMMSSLGNNIPKAAKELKEANEFERSTEKTRPLSIFYGGMYEACKQPNRILAELF